MPLTDSYLLCPAPLSSVLIHCGISVQSPRFLGGKCVATIVDASAQHAGGVYL